MKAVLVVSCFLTFRAVTPSVFAQHAAPHSGAVPVHVSAPPIRNTPISTAPMIHAPISSRMPIVSPTRGELGTAGLRLPRRPIHPFPPVLVVYESPFLFSGPFWGWSSCWLTSCDLFWPWMLDYTTVSTLGPTDYVSQVYATPTYLYGEERPDLPQLFLKDGTILSVTDYWLIDDQLHFTMIEEEGGKPVEHVVPFEALDLKKTVDVNTRRGFRFMLRNEPVEQYLRDHPEGPPPVIAPAQN